MKWSDIASTIGKAAPLLGSLLGGPAGGAAGGLIAKALGTDNTPESISQALQADPQMLERIKQLELEHEADLTRMHLEAESVRLAEINKTMRAETASNDAYVRRWRPTFGYIVAITWLLQTLGIVTAVVTAAIFKPENAGDILGGMATLMGALAAMWSVALAVLGVNVSSRSKDKATAAGQQPAGLLNALATRITRPAS